MIRDLSVNHNRVFYAAQPAMVSLHPKTLLRMTNPGTAHKVGLPRTRIKTHCPEGPFAARPVNVTCTVSFNSLEEGALEQQTSWVRGCAFGCGGLLLIAFLLATVGVLSIMRPLGTAVDTRIELDEAFGDQCSYSPPADGVVSDDRIESFLRIRRALADSCDLIDRRASAMRELEKLDDEPDMSRMAVLRMAGRATTGAFGLGPALGALYEARNNALLAEGMGLGEYTYIYVMAYHQRLKELRPGTGILDGSPVNRRIHGCLEGMLERQFKSAHRSTTDAAMTSALENELALLAADPSRLPWQDGMPSAIQNAFSPHRADLDTVFCAGATELELLRNTRRTLAIQSE